MDPGQSGVQERRVVLLPVIDLAAGHKEEVVLFLYIVLYIERFFQADERGRLIVKL